MSSENNTRNCLVCNSTSTEFLYHQRFSAISSVALLDGYDVVVCKDCGCVYASGIPPKEKFDKYYEEASKYEYAHTGGVSSNHDHVFKEMAELIAKQLPNKEAKILDIGCATGQLLNQLKQLGYKNLSGADPSPACAKFAKENFDIEVKAATFNKLQSEKGSYDLIIMMGVLEHIIDFDEVFRVFESQLAEDGILFIGVPDAGHFADHMNAPFQQFSIEHINFFSEKSMLNLMRTRGYTEFAVESVAYEYSKGTQEPVLQGYYKRGAKQSWENESMSRQSVQKYIDHCQSVEDGISERMQRLADSKEPVVVWGTGTHTLHLLETSPLKDANISFFVDSNTKYCGQDLHNRPIRPPQDIQQDSGAILVSSRFYQNEISQQIRQDLGLNNELITLYDV